LRLETAASTPNSTRNSVAPANAGQHFPERIENAIHGSFYGFEIVIVDVRGKHFAFSGGVFAVGFDVDAEILVGVRIIEAVMSLQSVDL
jgi:hypothetical protein